MKSYYLGISLLLIVACQSVVNTTGFWKQKLNASEIYFQSYAGYEQVDWYHQKGQSGMYYQLFGATSNVVNQSNPNTPLIIWLQGGPGGSSMFGAFTENGPIRIKNGTPKEFGSSWNHFGHQLFIDQPLNVGFSYAGEREGVKQVSTARQAADHLVNFMYNFYKKWPTLIDSPLYISGQSFAGHYIPAFSSAILMNDTFKQQTKINFKGLMIGDGWTDPINQFNYYDSYLYSAGIVSNKWRDTCTWYQTNGIINIYERNYKNASSYFDFLTNNDNTSINYWGGISIFNFRQYIGDEDETFADFLEKNKGSLGVSSNVKYLSGNDQVYNAFAEDIAISYASDVLIALNNNLRVLIYNGQEDFVVNTAGVLSYLNSLDWKNMNTWKRKKKQVWTLHGQVKGWAKVVSNFWFVLVNRAGHLVPTDQPESAFDMVGHFLRDDKNWNV